MSRIVESSLSCGMPLVVESNPGVRSAGICWILPAGSAREPAALEGLNAMWSELLLRGAGSLDSRAQADAFDRLGASKAANASTFHLQLTSTVLGDKVSDALGLLSDMVLRPRFDPTSINPARDLALQALESLADEPQERAFIAARARHRPAPINRSGLGRSETLTRIGRDDIVREWSRVSRPEGGVLAVAGAVEPDRVRARAEELLQGWSGPSTPLSFSFVGSRGYGHETDQTNQVQVVVLHDGPCDSNEDAWLERVVVHTLGGGMSGRLFTEVREKRGLCYSVSASYKAGKEYGTVSAYVGTTPERAQQSLDVLLGELDRVRSGIERDEFERAIVGMKSRLVFSGESTAARAGALAADVIRRGKARSLEAMAARIDRITLDEVNAYLKRRDAGTLTVQTLGPEPLQCSA